MADPTTYSSTSSLTSAAYSYAQEVWYVVVTWTILFLFIIYFVRSYASSKTFEKSWFIYASVCLAYMCSFGVLILIPMDLGLTNYRRGSTTYTEYQELQVYNEKLITMYESLYWPGLVLGSLILVISSGYLSSGYLSFSSKLADIMKKKAMIGVAALIFCIVVIIVLVKRKVVASQQSLLVAMISLNNTIGLFAIVFLLGFGLAELPKQLWFSASIQQRLKNARINAATEYRKRDEAYFDLLEIVSTAHKTCALADSITKKRDLLINQYVDRIRNDLPPSSLISRKGSGGEIRKDKYGMVTIPILASIRQTLNAKKRKLLIAESRCIRVSKDAFLVDDIAASHNYYTSKADDDYDDGHLVPDNNSCYYENEGPGQHSHDGRLVPFWERRVCFGSWIGKIHKTENYEKLRNQNSSSRNLNSTIEETRKSLQETSHLNQSCYERMMYKLGFNNEHNQLKYFEQNEAGVIVNTSSGVKIPFYLAPNPDENQSYTDNSLPLGGYSSTFNYQYEVYLRPLLYKSMAIIVFVLSLTIIISEAALIAAPAATGNGEEQEASTSTSTSTAKVNNASFLALLLHSENRSYSDTVVFGLFFLLFLLFILSFALSNLHIASAIEIVPGKATDALSMIFHSRLCVRLAAPLAFNFLTLCYESGVTTADEYLQSNFEVPSSITNISTTITTNSTIPVYTAFDTFYGNNVQFLPFLGNNFNTVVPILVLVFSLLHFCNLLNRGLAMIGLKSLQFGQSPPSNSDLERGITKLEFYREKQTKESINKYKRRRATKQVMESRSKGPTILKSIGKLTRKPSLGLKSRESIDVENPVLHSSSQNSKESNPYISFGGDGDENSRTKKYLNEEDEEEVELELEEMDPENRLYSSIRLTRQSMRMAPYAGGAGSTRGIGLEGEENDDDADDGEDDYKTKRLSSSSTGNSRDTLDALKFMEGYIFKLSGQKTNSKNKQKASKKTLFSPSHLGVALSKWQKRYFCVLGDGYLVYYSEEPKSSRAIPGFELNLNKIKKIQPHDGHGNPRTIDKDFSDKVESGSSSSGSGNKNNDDNNNSNEKVKHVDIIYVENSIFQEDEEVFTLSLYFEDYDELPLWISAINSAKRTACKRQSFISASHQYGQRSSLRRSLAMGRSSINIGNGLNGFNINAQLSSMSNNSRSSTTFQSKKGSIELGVIIPPLPHSPTNNSNINNDKKGSSSISSPSGLQSLFSKSLSPFNGISNSEVNQKEQEQEQDSSTLTSATSTLTPNNTNNDNNNNYPKNSIEEQEPPSEIEMMVEKRSGNKMRGYQPKQLSIKAKEPFLFLKSVSSSSSFSASSSFSPSSFSTPKFGKSHDFVITLSTLTITKISTDEDDTRILLQSTDTEFPKEGLKIKTKTKEECDFLIRTIQAWIKYSKKK